MKNFTQDKEKMNYFYYLTKEEFLKSYPYITEDEYKRTEEIERDKEKPINVVKELWKEIVEDVKKQMKKLKRKDVEIEKKVEIIFFYWIMFPITIYCIVMMTVITIQCLFLILLT